MMQFTVETCRHTGADYCSCAVRFRSLADAIRAAMDQCDWLGHELALIVLHDSRRAYSHQMATIARDTEWVTIHNRQFKRRRSNCHSRVYSGPLDEIV